MRIFLTLISSLLLFSSCGSIEKMIWKSKIRNKKIQEFSYNMSPAQLKVALTQQYFKGWRQTETAPGEAERKRIEKLVEKLEEGFMYKGQVFAGNGVDISSLIVLAMAEDRGQAFKAMINQDKFHTLEEDGNGFKLLFDNYVYEVEKTKDNKSKLRVYVISQLVKNQIVDLEASMKFMRRSSLIEWDVLKKVDKSSADQLEAAVEQDYKNGVRL